MSVVPLRLDGYPPLDHAAFLALGEESSGILSGEVEVTKTPFAQLVMSARNRRATLNPRRYQLLESSAFRFPRPHPPDTLAASAYTSHSAASANRH